MYFTLIRGVLIHIFLNFSMKTYVVVHIRSTEVPLMSIHYMCFFCEKISKISLLFRLKKRFFIWSFFR